MSKQAIDDQKKEVLKFISNILDDIETKIESLRPACGETPAEKVPQTELVRIIAEKYDLSLNDIYPLVSKLFIKKYPGIKVQAGRHGGVSKI